MDTKDTKGVSNNKLTPFHLKYTVILLVRPAGFEPATYGFVEHIIWDGRAGKLLRNSNKNKMFQILKINL